MKIGNLCKSITVLILLCAMLAGCGGQAQNPDTSSSATGGNNSNVLEYDLDSGEDLVLEVEAGSDCTVHIGDTRLDKTEFTVGEKDVRISSYSLMFLDLGETYTIKVQSSTGTKEFQVKMISTSAVSMDEETVVFDYEHPADVVKSADFGDQTITEIRVGARKYADKSLYSYDRAAKTLTLKKELLMSVTGETNLLVRLSGGKEFSFTVNSTLCAKADFEDAEENALLSGLNGMFWDTNIETVIDNGSVVGKLVPQYDHLFVFGDHYWGTFGNVAFEKGGSYQMEFDVKVGETSTAKTLNLYIRKAFDSYDPRCGIDPNGEGDDVQKYYTLDFSGNGCTGEGNMDVTYTYNEATGYAHVTIRFTASTAYNTILNCNTGGNYFDGDRPGESSTGSNPVNADNKAAYEAAKSVCWYFDNITVVKK